MGRIKRSGRVEARSSAGGHAARAPAQILGCKTRWRVALQTLRCRNNFLRALKTCATFAKNCFRHRWRTGFHDGKKEKDKTQITICNHVRTRLPTVALLVTPCSCFLLSCPLGTLAPHSGVGERASTRLCLSRPLPVVKPRLRSLIKTNSTPSIFPEGCNCDLKFLAKTTKIC